MSTNILRKYAAIFAFRYLCLLPSRQFFISTRWHVVLFLALSLASFPSQNLVSHFQSSISYFLKVIYSFFQKQQLNKFIFKCLISLGRFQALCKSQNLPPSPKKAIRFGPSKICLVLLHSSFQASCSARLYDTKNTFYLIVGGLKNAF